MANTNKAFGFRPVGRVGSTVANQGNTAYSITSNYGTAIYQGDCVTLSGGYVNVATSGPLLGVFIGCQYTDPTTKKTTFKNFYPGSIAASDIVAFVVDDPSSTFIVQCSGTAAVTAPGRNAVIVTSTGGSTITGISGQQVDVPATGNATYAWKVIGVYDAPGNNDLTSSYAELIVKPNNHLYNAGTGTAGV
jgi:hypothetical protein